MLLTPTHPYPRPILALCAAHFPTMRLHTDPYEAVLSGTDRGSGRLWVSPHRHRNCLDIIKKRSTVLISWCDSNDYFNRIGDRLFFVLASF